MRRSQIGQEESYSKFITSVKVAFVFCLRLFDSPKGNNKKIVRQRNLTKFLQGWEVRLATNGHILVAIPITRRSQELLPFYHVLCCNSANSADNSNCCRRICNDFFFFLGGGDPTSNSAFDFGANSNHDPGSEILRRIFTALAEVCGTKCGSKNGK